MCGGTSARGEEGCEADVAGIKRGPAQKVERSARKPWARNGNY